MVFKDKMAMYWTKIKEFMQKKVFGIKVLWLTIFIVPIVIVLIVWALMPKKQYK